MDVEVVPHVLARAEERGASLEEIRDVIRTGEACPAKYDRLARSKVYPFGRRRGSRKYDEKRIEVIYIIEDGVAVAITVYVFYGRWSQPHADNV
jgi:hypothetical protein